MTVSSLKRFDRVASIQPAMPLRAAARQALIGIGRLAGSMFGSAPSTVTTADELFDRAAAYEATQPSYAADLRAAALQASKHHFGHWQDKRRPTPGGRE